MRAFYLLGVNGSLDYELQRHPSPGQTEEKPVYTLALACLFLVWAVFSAATAICKAVVNAHGGLMKMKMELHVGQPMMLLNPQNKVEQSCRVVRVDDTPEGDYSVAFEFDKPNPKFWPVVFPPEDWNAPKA